MSRIPPSIIIVPGWRDSGPGHWQSLWAEQLPGALRVQQDDWITPARQAWVASITRTILDQPEPVVLADFAPVPYQALPYRSIVVASNNDPYCPVRTAGAYARAWGSEFVRLQNAGHINVESGFGPWPLGLALLQSLVGESWVAPVAHAAAHPQTALETTP